MKCKFSNEDISVSMHGMSRYPNKCFLSTKNLISCDGIKGKKGCPFWANSCKPPIKHKR